ncbi:protein-tyrosine phosphatase-like protein [Amylostereum chailletii]|nr:protein-tyrosine phosphatase-like protein [Amylostereum chailletii]
MPLTCEPLCHFGERLYFTTFPHPAPKQSVLNNLPKDTARPRIRGTSRAGPSLTSDDDAKYYYFTVDDQLVYTSFFQDWGPLNLAMVYKACLYIHQLLVDEELSPYRLVLYASDNAHTKANAALLMALFVLIVQQRAPWDAFQPIAELEFKPFRDAGRGRSDFNLSIQDCLWGIYKAIQNGLCDLSEFNVDEYEYYEKVENGDWNWITPNFIAFASPVDSAWLKTQKEMQFANTGAVHESPTRPSPAKTLALQRKLPTPFQNCLEYFEQRNVKLVVRLNNELYDRNTFLDRGISHLELYFDDGTNPTDEIVRRFIDVSDEIISAGGVVAVHCKAGLGRTGTLIGAYLVWKYGFTSSEAIAFMRIARPGCVVGPQQQFMYCKQLEWAKWAAVDEMRRTQPDSAVAITTVVAPVTPPADVDEERVPMEVESTQTVVIPSTPPRIPPVTPSKHVAAAAAKARSVAPPGQPRKTPNAKRHASDSSDEGDEDDVLPALGMAPPARKPRSPIKARGVTASEQRPTRVTRSAAANLPTTRKPGTAIPSVSNKANAPNKIPRLAHGTTARTTAATAAAAAALKFAAGPVQPTQPLRRTQRPPSPTPSRLPTLVPLKRGHQNTMSMSDVKAGTTLKPTQATAVTNEWVKTNANAVVKPGTKSERPGLRSARKRRSSFSAADVIV